LRKIVGTACGKDKPRIENGLLDVYDFRFIHSHKQVDSAANCDLVVVRKSFVSHNLCEAVENLVGRDKMHYIPSRSPDRVNEYLMNYYANL
jgi:hypothetical protein